MTKTIRYSAILLILFLVAARFINLDADPPLFYTGHGQAQITDPYNLTFFARNAVLYEDANPFDFHRWDIFKNSLISAISFILFSTAGVSRVTANISSLLLHLAGLTFFLMAFYKKDNLIPVYLTSLLLLINSTLFFYGRLPFLENGLIFLSGLTFWVTIRYHQAGWGQILAGGLVALAALSGKLFGLVLAGPLAVTLFYVYRKRLLLPAINAAAGFLATVGLYLLLFYRGSLSLLMSYYFEQSVEMYPSPPGLSSPMNFLKMLLTYGGDSGLHEYTPFIGLIGVICLVLVLLNFDWKKKPTPERIQTLFCLSWLILGVAGLMPFFYRPLRYALFLFLPLSGLVLLGFSLLGEKVQLRQRFAWPVWLAIFLVLWFAATQIAIYFDLGAGRFVPDTPSILLVGSFALVLTTLLFLWLKARPRFLAGRIVIGLLALLGVGVLVAQPVRIYDGLTQSGRNLKQYNAEFSEILDPGAVTTGPFMAAMNIDNKLKGVIYMFGLSNQQEDLFSRFPVSHVIADNSNWTRAQKDYPQLARATKITQVLVSDLLIGLFRVPDATVPLTEFEQGSVALSRGDPRTAIEHYTRFYQDHPHNMLGAIHLALAYQRAGRSSEAMELAKLVESRHSQNYFAHIFLAGYYKSLFESTGDSTYRTKSEKHKQIARETNPSAPD
ncbi:MAG: hypothetical protein P1R58_13315 [bacterium]|nr:hypothetical protein [bacterium]